MALLPSAGVGVLPQRDTRAVTAPAPTAAAREPEIVDLVPFRPETAAPAHVAGLPTPTLPLADLVSLGASSSWLAKYDVYTGSLPPVASATRAEIVAGMLEIVAVEGPVLGLRLHAAYVRSSAGRRVGPQVGRILNSAVTSAVRRGLLVQDDPLSESGVRPRTFRLPGQPEVVARELGPRTLDQVPPAELALVMHRVASQVGQHDLGTLFRATMAEYGIRRLGPVIRARLEAVWQLVERDQLTSADRPAEEVSS